MILSPSSEAPAREAEPAGEREKLPDPSALYEIYWPYLWGEAVGDEQH